MTSGVADLINRIEGMALDAQEVIAVREVLSRRLVDVSMANLSDKDTVAQASGRSRRAERLGDWHAPTGEVIAPTYRHTAAAMRDGAIGVGHYTVIDETLRNLPGTIRSDLPTWSEGERLMAEAARTMDPDELKKVGLHLHAHLNPDGEFDDSDRAQKRELSVSKQGADHLAGIKGSLDPATKALWDVVAAKWAAKGMNNPNDPDSPTGTADKVDKNALRAAAERDTRTPGQRNHDAFKKLMEMVVGQGRLGTHRGLPAQVIVTMTLEQLEQETGLATTASGGVLSI